MSPPPSTITNDQNVSTTNIIVSQSLRQHVPLRLAVRRHRRGRTADDHQQQQQPRGGRCRQLLSDESISGGEQRNGHAVYQRTGGQGIRDSGRIQESALLCT